MAEALDEDRPMPHRDHQDEGERDQAQDRPEREASGSLREPLGRLLGKSNRCHIGRGSPRRANRGLRARVRRLTCRARCGRDRRRRGCRHEFLTVYFAAFPGVFPRVFLRARELRPGAVDLNDA
jgi:hypothetical protein